MIAPPKIADLAALRSLISQRAPAAQTGIGVAEQLRQRGIAVIGDPRLKRRIIAASCSGVTMSGGLSHRRPLIIVDQVSPESIRAAAQDIGCRASEVNMLAVGTCAIN